MEREKERELVFFFLPPSPLHHRLPRLHTTKSQGILSFKFNRGTGMKRNRWKRRKKKKKKCRRGLLCVCGGFCPWVDGVFSCGIGGGHGRRRTSQWTPPGSLISSRTFAHALLWFFSKERGRERETFDMDRGRYFPSYSWAQRTGWRPGSGCAGVTVCRKCLV
jgi:hypothetical protein